MAFSWNSVLLSGFKLLQKNLPPKQNCLKFFIDLRKISTLLDAPFYEHLLIFQLCYGCISA